MEYNALKKLFSIKPHTVTDWWVERINDITVLDIKFQTGGTASTERNGIFIEDLLIAARAKLNEYNKQLPCRKNCWCMTHTINGKCGKCGEIKGATND